MKKIKLKFMSLTKLTFCVSVLLLMMSVACSKGGDDLVPESPTVAVSSIQLNKTSVSLSAGESIELTATVLPENATNKTVTWSSSNTSIAKVTNGKITAVGIGSATITAQAGDVKAECLVTIGAIEVTSIRLNKSSVSLSVGESVELIATVLSEDAMDKAVSWLSSNTSIAKVTNGKVTAVGVGSATITAQAGDSKAECLVAVGATGVTSIELNKTSVTLSIGEIIELTATVSPEDAVNKTVTWSSSNESVATVIDGRVTAVGVGSATITAQAGDFKAECLVAVGAAEVTSIKLNKTSVTLFTGEIIELIATISPESATNKTVMWSSSDTNVVTVVDGKVTAVGAGSATITAKSNNGLSTICRIAVVGKDVSPGGSEETGEEEWKK